MLINGIEDIWDSLRDFFFKLFQDFENVIIAENFFQP
jgi:hypothetical protein